MGGVMNTVLLCLAVLLVSTWGREAHAEDVFPLSPTSSAITKSLSFLKQCQNDDGGFGQGGITEWVIIALGAAGQDPGTWKKNGHTPLDYLAKHFRPTTIWDYTRAVLALSFAGLDPRDFCGMDCIRKVKDQFSHGQMGDPLSLRDDYWGIIALAAAGESESIEVISSAAYIKRHQKEDGSWGATITDIEICADNTAIALIALQAAGENRESPVIQRGLAYLKQMQQHDGGFPYLFVPSNAATDAWVIQALAAAEKDPTAWKTLAGDPVTHLLSLQRSDGSFTWTAKEDDSSSLMTAYAIPALLGNFFTPAAAPGETITVSVRIEGSAGTIYDGVLTCSDSIVRDSKGLDHHFKRPTPLSILEAAAQEKSFTYTVDAHSSGLYVWDIGHESGRWEYRVNNCGSQKGADRYYLQNGDEVLWCAGANSLVPLRLVITDEVAAVKKSVPVTIEMFDDPTWIPSPVGIVWINNSKKEYAGGAIDLLLNTPGSYTLIAESAGCIRSARKTLRVLGDSPITVSMVIQGKSECLWNGPVTMQAFDVVHDMDGCSTKVAGHSLIGALAEVSRLHGIPFQIKQTSQGLIIVSVGNDQEDNLNGSWWYTVNAQKVINNADEVALKEGDAVLLYYSRLPRT